MSFKFKPEHFPFRDEKLAQLAVVQANLLLQAHLATLPRITARKYDNGFGRWIDSEYKTEEPHEATHTALLWGITEIEKKECIEHIPKLIEGSGFGVSLMLKDNECVYCGVKLKAKWEKV